MDNNNEALNPNAAPTPAPAPTPTPPPTPTPAQPNVQPVPQPTPQPAPQQAPQPMGQPFPPQVPDPTMAGTPTTPEKSKKNLPLIIGCIVGVVAVIAIVVVLLLVFLKGGSKTVSCTQTASMMGIDIEGTTNIEVTDGKILGGDMTATINLKNLSELYASHEQELVDSILENYQSQCNEGCTYDHDYVAGDHLTINAKYDVGGMDDLVYTSGIEGKSAQEIADKIQQTLEQSSGTTCKQN